MLSKKSIFLLVILGSIVPISFSFDDAVSSFFESIKIPLLELAFSIMTNFAFVVLITLIIPSFLIYGMSKRHAANLWMVFVAAFVLNFILKLIVRRQRPLETVSYPIINVLNYSFPSTHAIIVFSMLPMLVKYFPKLKYFWIVFACLIGFTRIYLSYHFISDVLAGAFFGIIIGLAMLYFLENYEKKNLGRS